VTSEIDTSKANIGDVITWQIKGDNSGENNTLEYPKINLKGDSISIYSQRLIFNNKEVIGRTIEIAFWDTGRFYTPLYFVNVLDQQGNFSYDLKLEKIPIDIISVLESLGDVNARPVKGPIPVPRIIPYRKILLVLLSLLIIFSIIWVWNKRIKRIYQISNLSDRKLPIEIANGRMSSLNNKGFAKDFYTELSHITREYIEYSSYIRTLEMTTEEIILNRNLFIVNDKNFSEWIALLTKADLVKYAKHSITSSEMENDKNTAINIINHFFN
tara:strand:+ start:742 stop:1554 length:813 start_codon:yes stop_codon:yes gene_type:complete